MTPAEAEALLADAAARADAAMPGPWFMAPGGERDVYTTIDGEAVLVARAGNTSLWPENDAVFIAAARTDVPALIALAREQMARAEQAERDRDAAVDELHAARASNDGLHRAVAGALAEFGRMHAEAAAAIGRRRGGERDAEERATAAETERDRLRALLNGPTWQAMRARAEAAEAKLRTVQEAISVQRPSPLEMSMALYPGDGRAGPYMQGAEHGFAAAANAVHAALATVAEPGGDAGGAGT